MRKRTSKKAFTLIEIIVSIAIFSIMFVVFLSLFSTSFIQVIRGGDIGKAVYAVQTEAEAEYDNTVAAGSGTSTITVNFGPNSFSVDGDIRTLEENIPNDSSGDKVRIRIFIPESGE